MLFFGAAETAAQDFEFDPTITQSEVERLSLVLAGSLYGSPVEPADSGGLLGFDLGIAVSAIEIDENASYWIRSVDTDFLEDGYLLAPRLVVSKGFNRLKLHGSYAEIPDTEVEVIGAALDLTLVDEGFLSPAIGARGVWTELRGVDELDLQTTGIELIVSKKIGPLTPWFSVGQMSVETTALIRESTLFPAFSLSADLDEDRISAGARFSMLLFQVAAEATEVGEDRVYAIKANLSL